ncbi:hypothetical protein IAT38_005820 [Cryptococcus sp. DSM 104549]
MMQRRRTDAPFLSTGEPTNPTDIDPKLLEPRDDDRRESSPESGSDSEESSVASGSSSPVAEDAIPGSLDDVSNPLKRVASLIKSGQAKNVVLLLGAGISTSAGIPDFRSPSTGLYHNLQALNLPFPEAVFELGFFQKRPEPFWTLAKEIYPGRHYPTPTHYLLPLLDSHRVLKRVLTQNIDTLETLAGLPADKIVEAHGSFATSHCLKCRREVDRDEVLKAGVRRGEVVKCESIVKGKKCGGLVKPDIVFFGEGLPDRFFKLIPELKKCDLLIVIGTSLQVQPFASLVDYVPSDCPRLLINREPVGPFSRLRSATGVGRFLGGKAKASGRDMFYEGDADEGVWRLVEALGWKEELEILVAKGRKNLEKEWVVAEGGAKAKGENKKDAERRAGKAAKEIAKVEKTEGEELEEAIKNKMKL